MMEYTMDEFIEKRRNKMLHNWLSGVYLIGNKTQRKYYVGQSICVQDRIFTHITGRGNGDIYFDIRSGDDFIIRYYPFDPNQFRTIDELEFHLIRIYEANVYGYNRQAGNRVTSA